jgi:hypothetical protein
MFFVLDPVALVRLDMLCDLYSSRFASSAGSAAHAVHQKISLVSQSINHPFSENAGSSIVLLLNRHRT